MLLYTSDKDISLKLLTLQNAKELFELVESNRHILREWLEWVDSKKTITDFENSIEQWGSKYISNSAINVGIFYKDELAGMIALQNIEWKGKTTNFGYWLAPKFEGKGIMVRCVKELISFAFKILHLNRLQISCAEDNVKSRALPEKLGFIQEGILRENYCVHGKVHNLVVYSLLRNEWVEDNQ